MKTSIWIGGVAALALAASAGMVVAQQGPVQDPPSRQGPARGDTDGDGRLSRAEFVDARIARLVALDTDGDGIVTREERQAAHQARRAERADRHFARLDANGDGAVTRAEYDAARAARESRRAEQRAQRVERRAQGAEPRAERGPRRGEGRMGPGRRGGAGGGHWGLGGGRDAGPVVIAEVESRLSAEFTRLDTNGDGYLSREERRAGMQQRREQRQEGREARRARTAPASE